MNKPIKLRIVGIILEWNMNSIHSLRKRAEQYPLARNQCLIAFNRKQTIARIIDCMGGVHTYYSEKNQAFDVEELNNLVHDSFHVSIYVQKNDKGLKDIAKEL